MTLNPYTFLLCLAIPGVIRSQPLRQPLSFSYLGLGAYSSEQADVFSYTNNQAALAQIKGGCVGIYGERKFLLAATSAYKAALALTSKGGNFGLNLGYSGFKNFAEYQLGVAYAKQLAPWLDVGMQFNYHGYTVPAYTSASTVNFELGAIVHVNDKVAAAFHVYNPVGGTFAKTQEKLSSIYKLGIGYDASDQLFIAAELVQQQACGLNVNAGLQYQFAKQFFLRLGVATGTSTGYLGAGISWKTLRLDLTTTYHAQLGLWPGLLLTSAIGKKS